MGLPNVYGEGSVGGKTHWLCRLMTHSSGGLASCHESRNKPLLPDINSCAHHIIGAKRLPGEEKENQSVQMPGRKCVKHITETMDCPVYNTSYQASKIPEPCVQAKCSSPKQAPTQQRGQRNRAENYTICKSPLLPEPVNPCIRYAHFLALVLKLD